MERHAFRMEVCETFFCYLDRRGFVLCQADSKKVEEEEGFPYAGVPTDGRPLIIRFT